MRTSTGRGSSGYIRVRDACCMLAQADSSVTNRLAGYLTAMAVRDDVLQRCVRERIYPTHGAICWIASFMT
jgi:hypothetical protein